MKQAVGLQRIILLSIIFSLIVILLGAYTRLKDAGLGCPDWPGCYGQLTAPLTETEVAQANQAFPGIKVEYIKAKIEMVHRYFAGTLGLLIFFIAGLAYYHRKKIALPISLPIALVGLVIFQAALGMWTVTMRLNPPIVLMHLLGGFSTLSLLWICWLCLKPKKLHAVLQVSNKLAILGLFSLGVLICQIILGGWVSTNYAALICTDFPMCQGQWLPSSPILDAFPFFDLSRVPDQLSASSRVNIQLTHRIGAFLTACLIGLLAVSLWRQSLRSIDPKTKRWLQRITFAVGFLLLLQLSLGVINILALLPIWIAVLHNAVAALLLLTVLNINFRIYQARRSK